VPMCSTNNMSSFLLQPQSLSDTLVELIPLAENDFERLFLVASDPLIWEQHPSRDRYKREVFQKYFDGALESRGALLVFDKATKEVIGSSRYYDLKPSSVAIGYTFLARKYWGGNYNKAMKRLMLDYAFQFVDSVRFHIGPDNIRSQKAVLKIGAKKTGEVELDYYGGKLVHFEYEIKKTE
jgi:RimJ/RimL family protein N-acetyltransferase